MFGDLRGPPFVVLICGPGVSMEKESLDGNGNGLPELLAAPTERGESPVDDGDMFPIDVSLSLPLSHAHTHTLSLSLADTTHSSHQFVEADSSEC